MKADKIRHCQEMLREKRGYPDLSFLRKLTETEIFWLMLSIGGHDDYMRSNDKKVKK